MKRSAVFLAVWMSCASPAGSDTPKRPRIIGIAGVTILSSDIPDARGFYRHAIDPSQSRYWSEAVPSPTLSLAYAQTITLEKMPAQPPSSFLKEITFRTESLDQLARFFQSKQVDFKESKYNSELWRISLRDPEGHPIAFAGMVKPLTSLNSPSPSPARTSIIHAGFVVCDRVATDHFYKDILGFRPYWHGGMRDNQDDWVAMQVPDGTAWVEYMLNVSAKADSKELGVMNHIALGVTDIHATQAQLLNNGLSLPEEPQMGRDGKWQLNVYDPDFTRVEFMEFTPVQKPCCSEFSGPHPQP